MSWTYTNIWDSTLVVSPYIYTGNEKRKGYVTYASYIFDLHPIDSLDRQ